VETPNYSCTPRRAPFFLTLYEKRVAPRDLPFFLGLMEHWPRRPQLPDTVHDAQGRMLRTPRRPAALVTFLEGVWIRRPQPRHCGRWARRWLRCIWPEPQLRAEPGNALGVSGWRPLYQRFQARADEIAPAGWPAVNRARARPPRGQLAGQPAAGHHPLRSFSRQRFFLGDQLSGLIDFYFACNDALAYDVAIALTAWCFERRPRLQHDQGPGGCSGAIRARAPFEPPNARPCRWLASGAALRWSPRKKRCREKDRRG